MDEIIVFVDEQTVQVYGESPLMECGQKNFKLLSEASQEIPKFVLEKFEKWQKNSTLDGTNESLEVQHGKITYRFVNHYWD